MYESSHPEYMYESITYLTPGSGEPERTMTFVRAIQIRTSSLVEAGHRVTRIDTVLTVKSGIARSTGTRVRVDSIVACSSVQTRAENREHTLL